MLSNKCYISTLVNLFIFIFVCNKKQTLFFNCLMVFLYRMLNNAKLLQ